MQLHATDLYTLSLHDALPIYFPIRSHVEREPTKPWKAKKLEDTEPAGTSSVARKVTSVTRCTTSLSTRRTVSRFMRSEEHTSELPSPCNLVCRLLLDKQKKNS